VDALRLSTLRIELKFKRTGSRPDAALDQPRVVMDDDLALSVQRLRDSVNRGDKAAPGALSSDAGSYPVSEPLPQVITAQSRAAILSGEVFKSML